MLRSFLAWLLAIYARFHGVRVTTREIKESLEEPGEFVDKSLNAAAVVIGAVLAVLIVGIVL